MAFIGDSCVYFGSPDWYIGDPLAYKPTVQGVFPGNAQYGLYAIARVDARSASATDPLDDPIFYEWNVVKAPPKSLKKIDIVNKSELLITLDEIGIYAITLVVSSANGGCSNTAYSIIVSQPFSAPYESQQMYSVEWIWDMLPDFWKNLPQKNRLLIETLWRGNQQLIGKEYMSLLNARDSISIETIQDRIIKKWFKIDLSLDLEIDSFFVARTDVYFPINIVENQNNFITKFSAPDRVRNFESTQTKGYLVNPKAVILENFSGQNFDSSKIIIIQIEGRNDIRSRVAFPITIGNKAGVSLVDSVILDAQMSFPVECRVVLKPSTTTAFGLFRYGNDISIANLDAREGNNLLFTVPNTKLRIDENISTIRRPIQIKLPRAELLGISTGDVIELQILNDLNKSFDIAFDVLSAAGDYIAIDFKYNFTSLIKNIVDKLESDIIKSEIYGLIITEVLQKKWQNRYLNTWLNKDAYFEFGLNSQYYRKYYIKFNKVFRRKKIPIDNNIINLIKLTERTERFLIVDDKLITEGNEEVLITREPLELYENLDFYVRFSTDYGVALSNTLENLDVFSSPRFDFIIAGTQVGDILQIQSGLGKGSYEIVEFDDNSVKVTPSPQNTFSGANFSLRPRDIDDRSNYLIFRENVVPNDGVRYLWCESAVYDHNTTVEANFGYLLNFFYSDWVKFGITSSYKNTLIGLLLGKMHSPTLKNIENFTSIVSGIPFSNAKSIIVDIDKSYEKDEFGTDKITKVTLEALDNFDAPTQRYNTYFLKSTHELRNPDFSGITINNNTGARFNIGDIIPKYTALGLGVSVNDLYEDSWLASFDDVIDRHRFSVTLDTDSIAVITEEAIDFIYSFIKEIKPSYTDFVLKMYKYLVDIINIESEIFPKLRHKFFDNPYRLRGVANILDDIVPDRMLRDEAVHIPLTTWFPKDGVLSCIGNEVYSIFSELGGFKNPLNIQGFMLNYFEQPWIKEKDFVFLRNKKSIYTILSVESDNLLLLEKYRVPVEELPLINEPLENTLFYVGRYRKDILLRADIENVSPDEFTDFTMVGDSATDLAIGDKIVFKNDVSTSLPLTVTSIDYNTEIPKINTFPLKPAIIQGNSTVALYRESITDRVLYEGSCKIEVIHNQREYPIVRLLEDKALFLGVEPGDLFQYQEHFGVITSVSRDNTLGLHPPIPAFLDNVERNLVDKLIITRKNVNEGMDDLDEHEYSIKSKSFFRFGKIPLKVIQGIIYVDPTFSNNNEVLRPGDIIYFESLPTINHGEGQGIVRIISPVSLTLNGAASIEFYSTLPKTISIDTINCYIVRQKPLSWEYFISNDEENIYPGEWGSEFRRF